MAVLKLTNELQSIMDAEGVCVEFTEWLAKEGILEIRQFAVLCANESEVKSMIFDEMTNKLGMKERSAAKLAWISARKVFDTPAISARPEAGSSDQLPAHVEQRLIKVWKDKHGFMLHGGMLMSNKLLNQLYRCLHMETKELPFVPVAQIKLKNSLSGPSLTGTHVTATGVIPMSFDIEECTT